jgi:hypothetical protein
MRRPDLDRWPGAEPPRRTVEEKLRGIESPLGTGLFCVGMGFVLSVVLYVVGSFLSAVL